MPIPVAARSKAWVCGRSLTRIVGSNSTGGMGVCVVFVVRTLIWNVKCNEERKDLNSTKMDQKGKNPGQKKNPGSVHVGFVVDKGALGQVFPPSTSVFPSQFHFTGALLLVTMK